MKRNNEKKINISKLNFKKDEFNKNYTLTESTLSFSERTKLNKNNENNKINSERKIIKNKNNFFNNNLIFNNNNNKINNSLNHSFQNNNNINIIENKNKFINNINLININKNNKNYNENDINFNTIINESKIYEKLKNSYENKYLSISENLINTIKSKIDLNNNNYFEIPYLKNIIDSIKENYSNQNLKNKIICEYCNSKANSNNYSNFIKCNKKYCYSYFCCEKHFYLIYNKYHFYHCNLKNFFIKYKFTDQINFYNDFIILIGNIIKEIFSNIINNDYYIFYYSYLKIIINLFKLFNINHLIESVFDLSLKYKTKKNEINLKNLIFYQECIFFYYNIIILSINFLLKSNNKINNEFIIRELENINNDETQIFNKKILSSFIFKKDIQFFQENIEFNINDKFFFINKNFIEKNKYLKQNDLLFHNMIHLYSNYIKIIDKLNKENPLNRINLKELDNKLKNQIIILFEERNHEYYDNSYFYFLSFITPFLILNKKINLSEIFYLKLKNNKLLNNDENKNKKNIFTLFNLGVLQYSSGKFLHGIHNIELCYKLLSDNYYNDYNLLIKVIETLALAYLNIRELLKSYILIRESLFLREKIKTKKNKIKILYLNIYLNYIKDFIEYEYKLKNINENNNNKNTITDNENKKILINYILGNYTNKNTFLLDIYNDDYFKALEFIFNLNKKVINKLNNDNLSKKNIYINNDKNLYNNNSNNSNNINIIKDNNNNNNNINFHDISMNSINNEKKLSDVSSISNLNINIKDFNEKEEILEFEEEIDIKEDVFDLLTRNEKITLSSINNHTFTRKNILRDIYGPINYYNINYHPYYIYDFKDIIKGAGHNFFIKKLTHCDIKDLGNYFNEKEDKNLEGLFRYIQQEEIQNMIKVEKTKLIFNKDSENFEDNESNDNNKNDDDNNNNEIKENEENKKKWIDKVKELILEDKKISIIEIDKSLEYLYDNLNMEYKKEIIKNPELILYYIFSDFNNNNN